MNESIVSEDRKQVLNKIKELEHQRKFDEDVENDPPTIPLKPGEVDYLHKHLKTRIMSRYSFWLAHKVVRKLEKAKQFKIEKINGLENLNSCKNGAVITCNHFSAFDSFVMELTFEASCQEKEGKKMFRIIREGNYSQFKGFYGLLMRYCNTVPLASNLKLFKEFIHATNTILQRGDFLLVYAEESMWWNYRKPKPLKPGAFHFAVKNNVPILPIFITMRDSDVLDSNNYPVQIYVVNIGKPIYLKKELDVQSNIEFLKAETFKFNVETYENFYKTKLQYE
jgi:1-acyl-sn-glycerol-3-phosphate acyltransferase